MKLREHRCPSCGHSLGVIETAGQRFACPSCGSNLKNTSYWTILAVEIGMFAVGAPTMVVAYQAVGVIGFVVVLGFWLAAEFYVRRNLTSVEPA